MTRGREGARPAGRQPTVQRERRLAVVGLHGDVVSQRFERLAKRATAPRLRLHDPRHTHATLLLAAGVPAHVVSRRLGHASEAFTLQQYGHLLPQQQRDAADRIATMVDG
jgi:integrase